MTLTSPDLEPIAELLEAEVDEQDRILYRPHYNLAPSMQHWIALETAHGRRLVPARWGQNVGPRFVINARAEGSARRGALRDAFAHRRCVVPADGFYEWTGPRTSRQPLWFHPPAGLLLFAALYEETPREKTFVILTTAANERVRPVHDRMPAILAPDQLAAWLSGPPPRLEPAPDSLLVATAVSQRVNRAENDDPACLEPVSAPPAGEVQLRLL